MSKPKNRASILLFLLILFLPAAHCVRGADQYFADLGDFKLENGGIIRNCIIGYRTFGKINSDKSNVVIFLMWAGGRTEQVDLEPSATEKLIDTNKYYVIAIDPISNGVSSSPSNSKLQPRMRFPEYSMRDVINTQYSLLTRKLGISHAKAIVGLSMGGMQTFQWMVSYPDFADLAIPIVGSPRLAPYDLVHWQSQVDAIMSNVDWKKGNYKKEPALVAEYEFGAILLTTPENFNRKMTREKVKEEIDKARSNRTFDANNKIRQVQAMMSIDISMSFAGSWENTAAAVKSRALVIVARHDHVVTPGPALKLAELLHARTLILEGDCGHLAASCEANKVNKAVADFLN